MMTGHGLSTTRKLVNLLSNSLACASCYGSFQLAARQMRWFCVWILVAAFYGCYRNSKMEVESKPQETENVSSNPNEPPEDKADPTRTVVLKIGVSGFGNSAGSCRVAVYLGQTHFNDPEYAISKESIEIHDSKAIWEVELKIPAKTDQTEGSRTRIAVSAYHDENGNSRLDKSSLGIPTERYGFSENPKRGFGPPKFSEAAMELNSAEQPDDSNVILEVPILIK